MIFDRIVVLGVALVAFALVVPGAWARQGDFLVGASKKDITGPAAELGMMGYADLWQTTRGIHSRLFARAFVIESRKERRRIAFVSADLAFITQAVKLAVVERLNQALPGAFSVENVMLTATHTHSGPGGFSHYTLYNVTILGFDGQNFNAIVSGITGAILEAYAKREPAAILYNEGELSGVTVNRSLQASDPLQPGEPSFNVNDLMTQLKAVAFSGRELGVVNWFSIHGTSMSKDNRLVSSDNKGYAAWLFEKFRGGDFVAAFANSDEGDVSPNIYGNQWERLVPDGESVRVSGTPQFKKALELDEAEGVPLSTPLDYRHVWVRMPGFHASGAFTGHGEQVLCLAGLGYSFAAGAKDGPSGVPGFHEGMVQGQIDHNLTDPLLWLYKLLSMVVFDTQPEDQRCHAPKPVLISTGRQDPPWTPDVLPMQLFRIGKLAIAGVPAEFTTNAGKRLRELLLDQLRPIGVTRVVIAGLANTYSNYVTTTEDYQFQDYEGASTLFGPYTIAAYLQTFWQLAQAMANGVPALPGDPLPVLHGPLLNLQPGVVFDDKRIWEEYGMPLRDAQDSYARGQTLRVPFRTGHPKNDLRLGASYFEIQKRTDQGWVTVATENDPEVTYLWKRSFAPDCLACSSATISWVIPYDTEPGLYRIVHNGARRIEGSGKIVPFGGYTKVFRID